MKQVIYAVIALIMVTNLQAAVRNEAGNTTVKQIEIHQISPVEITVSSDGTISFKCGELPEKRVASGIAETKYFVQPLSADL